MDVTPNECLCFSNSTGGGGGSHAVIKNGNGGDDEGRRSVGVVDGRQQVHCREAATGNNPAQQSQVRASVTTTLFDARNNEVLSGLMSRIHWCNVSDTRLLYLYTDDDTPNYIINQNWAYTVPMDSIHFVVYLFRWKWKENMTIFNSPRMVAKTYTREINWLN